VVFVDQSGQVGGAELFLADLARECGTLGRVLLLDEGPFVDYLHDRNVTVDAVSLPDRVRRLSKDAGLLAIAGAAPPALLYLREIRRRLKKATVIYCNTPKAVVIGGVAASLGRQILVVHLHDLLTEEHFSRLNLRLLAFFARRASLVIANSRATAAAFTALMGRVTRVEVAYNGFDPGQFGRPADFSPLVTRSDLRLPNTTLLGIFGRLTRWKGQHVALAAMRLIPEAHLVVVGDALFTQDDRRYREELHAMGSEPELRGRVHFLGFRPDIAPLLQAMDVVLHCSVAEEPFGRVIVEAMLAGTPVVATRGGGVQEIVTDGWNGLLVSPNDPTALAEAVRRYLLDPGFAERLSVTALEHARRTFSLAATVGRIRELLESMISTQ